MARLSVFSLLALCLVALVGFHQSVSAEQLQLSSIMPKLDAIYEDSKTLLLKNTELKAKILVGLQAQINAKLAKQNAELAAAAAAGTQSPTGALLVKPTSVPAATAATSASAPNTNGVPGQKTEEIDFVELEEFNKWVEVNLEYAIKNTRASIDALKEEAALNSSGTVDYSEQAIADGIEGIKYWQAAVIFQDKTLKNEKYDME